MMITHRIIQIENLEFNCRTSGNPDHPAVILLHGFPETSIMWTRLMEYLSSIGYYCIAPDMRGYSAGACPKGVKNYTMDKLTADIFNIATELNVDKFHLIAHDWGALIGWNIVYNHPERIISWTSLSIPHNRAIAKAYKTDPVQRKKSSYIKLFILPWLPEYKIRKDDFKGFRRLWKNSPPEEVEHYLSVFRRKASLTAALNYYRANLRKGKRMPVGTINTPTLFIWGKTDLAVGETAAIATEKYMKGDYEFLAVEGGHWLIQTNYEDVKQSVEKHLARNT